MNKLNFHQFGERCIFHVDIDVAVGGMEEIKVSERLVSSKYKRKIVLFLSR